MTELGADKSKYVKQSGSGGSFVEDHQTPIVSWLKCNITGDIFQILDRSAKFKV